MAKKERKSIKISAKGFEQLDYLCEAMNRSKVAFLSELVDQIFEVAGTFESLNVSYMVYGNSVRIEFSGRNRIVTGSFKSPINESDAETDAKIMKKSKDALAHKLEKAFESEKA